jgi:hypothetical protein
VMVSFGRSIQKTWNSVSLVRVGGMDLQTAGRDKSRYTS